MSLINVQNSSLGYESRKIVTELNFNVNEGDYLCIVGENGSGKSTLMKTILGLIPPIEGKIVFGDGLKQNEIGYLPQQTDLQKDFPASVQEVVISGCLNRCGLRPFYNIQEKRISKSNLDRLGISHLSKHCYGELSGGQQQRVLLARALCATRKILLLDEPVAGLDPKATKDMYDLIYDLNEKDNITIIMISHHIMAARRYASHILHIEKKPLFFGSKKDYLKTNIGNAYKKFLEVN